MRIELQAGFTPVHNEINYHITVILIFILLQEKAIKFN